MKKLNRLLINILLITIILVGVGILLYPTVSNWLQSQYHKQLISTYNKDIEALPEDFVEEEWQKAIDYNQSLLGKPHEDPFVGGSDMAYNTYMSVLNINGIMGYIDIPGIDVHLPIYHGTSEEVLKKGVGHLENTAFPIGGEGLNSILSAHTGVPSAKLFTDLVNVKLGDMFSICVMNKIMHYKVDDIKVILPEESKNLVAVSGKDYVTLLTCTPYGINSHRLVVRGERCFELSESIVFGKESRLIWKGVLIGSGSLALILLVVIIARSLKKRKREVYTKSSH